MVLAFCCHVPFERMSRTTPNEERSILVLQSIARTRANVPHEVGTYRRSIGAPQLESMHTIIRFEINHATGSTKYPRIGSDTWCVDDVSHHHCSRFGTIRFPELCPMDPIVRNEEQGVP